MTDEISFPPLFDVPPRQLEAQKQHLLSAITGEPERRRLALPSLPQLRLRFAVPVAAAVCVAAVVAVVFTGTLGGSSAHRPNSTVWSAYGPSVNQGPGSQGADTAFTATMAQPLPNGRQISLADAPGELGAPVTLPSSSLVQPSALGPVWVAGQSPVLTVAVTVPSQGLIFEYTRPAPTDPSATYQAIAQETPNIFQFIHLSGVPTLTAKENSDDTGHNFGSVIFVSGGVEIRVMGHTDQATLESLALSILSQSGGSK